MIVTAIKLLLVGCIIAANIYYLLSILAGFRFFSRRKAEQPERLLPVTIMIPLHGADFKAYENYAEFCRQDYPDYQVVFGARDPDDSSIPIVHRLIENFPERDIALVVSS